MLNTLIGIKELMAETNVLPATTNKYMKKFNVIVACGGGTHKIVDLDKDQVSQLMQLQLDGKLAVIVVMGYHSHKRMYILLEKHVSHNGRLGKVNDALAVRFKGDGMMLIINDCYRED